MEVTEGAGKENVLFFVVAEYYRLDSARVCVLYMVHVVCVCVSVVCGACVVWYMVCDVGGCGVLWCLMCVWYMYYM